MTSRSNAQRSKTIVSFDPIKRTWRHLKDRWPIALWFRFKTSKNAKWHRMRGLLQGRAAAVRAQTNAGGPARTPTCNVCGFVSTEGRIRICPSCQTNQRQRSFKQLLTETLEPNLFAQGTWRDALLLSPGAVERALLAMKFKRHIVSSLHQVLPGNNFVRADIVDLAPFADGSFDFVEACNVLDYVPKMERAIQSVYRVIRPKGAFVFLIPEHNLADGNAEIRVSTRESVTGSYWPDRGAVPAVSVGRLTLMKMLTRTGFEAEEVRLIEPLSAMQCTWWICRRW